MATFTVRGKNIEITPSLREYVEKRVGKVTKYFDSVGDIKVLLTASQWLQTLDIAASILRPAWWDPDAEAATTTTDLITAIDLMNQRDGPAPADR